MRHASEDILEEYALGRLGEPDAAPLEEHLLICPVCQDRLRGIDQFISALRGASALSQPGAR